MKDVYMCLTPYHVTLSCAIALAQDDSIEKELLVSRNFPNVGEFINGIKKWDSNPFDSIETYHGQYEMRFQNTFILKELELIYLFRKETINLKKRYSGGVIDNLYLSTDANPVIQYMACLNHRNGGSNIYIEDGIAPYKQESLGDFKYPSFVNKIAFGREFEVLEHHGQYKYIGRLMLLRPEYVRPELKQKTINRIEREWIVELNKTGLPEEILDQLDVKIPKKTNLTILVLPHSDFLINNELLSIYRKRIKQLMESKTNILIKYHPREENHYLDDIIDPDRVLPQSVPMEVIFLYLMDKPPKSVIGTKSTSLLTAKLFYKETKVISLVRLFDFHISLEDMFEKIGVFIPENFDELERMLKENIR